MTEEITKPTTLLMKIGQGSEWFTHKKGIHHQKVFPMDGQRQDDSHSCPVYHMGPLGTKARWQEVLTWDPMAPEQKAN